MRAGATSGGSMALGAVVCNDVTSGDNATAAGVGGYHAKAGYDAVTGWGTPKGTALLEQLTKLV